MRLVRTLSIYGGSSSKSNSAFYGENEQTPPYIQVNDISYSDDNEPVVEAGRPLTMEEASKIFTLVSPDGLNKPCLLPPNVLMWHKDSSQKGYRCIFWVKSHVAPLFHTSLDETLLIPWPSLVFSVTQQGISVYAIKNKRNRPTDQTRLYHAPFWNTYNRGNVCMGSCQLTTHKTVQEAVTGWQNFWFNSKFTGEGGTTQFGGYKNLLDFWKAQKDKTSFSSENLKETGHKLGDLI